MDGSQIQTDPETGDLLVLGTPAAAAPSAEDEEHFGNLIGTVIEEETAQAICSNLLEKVESDEVDRAQFIEQMADHVKLLGVGPESAPDDTEYENANTSDHPLLLTSLTRFISKALSALMPLPDKVARAEPAQNFNLIDDDDARDEARANTDGAVRRVEAFYAEYLLRGDIPYREEFDTLLMQCGLHGGGFKKVYNDRTRQRNQTRVEWVPAQDLIISYASSSLTSGRVAHRMEVSSGDLIRAIQTGAYVGDGLSVASDLGGTNELTEEEDRVMGLTRNIASGSSHLMYEVRTHLYLAEDAHPLKLPRPYVITLHVASQSVVSIRRNWQPNDPDELPIESFVGYIYSPGMRAVQGMGLGQILGNITRALRSAQRAGLDAAYLQNLPFGFKLAGMKIRNESQKIVPGEFIDVDSPTDDIRRAVQSFQFSGVSAGLIQLSSMMEANGKELGGIASIDFAAMMKSGVAAGPAMAAFEESTEFQTAVHRRLYDANATELRLIHDRMQEAVGGRAVSFGDGELLFPDDLKKVRLTPVMRPGQSSRQKVLLEAQALFDTAQAMPDVVSKRKAAENYLRALGREDIDDFMLPDPDDIEVTPSDPATEYGAILKGMPVKAGPAQNHPAHIDAHISQLRMLQSAQIPLEQGDAAAAALSAHIVEHHALDMVAQIAGRLGLPMEAFVNGIPPEMEVQLAPQIASITQQIEAERAPPEAQGDDKVQLEQVKQQGAMSMAQLKHQQDVELEALKAQHQQQLQRMKDDADMDRALQDDATALKISKLTGRSTNKAGTMS